MTTRTIDRHRPMRLAFLGSGAFGVPTLTALADRHEVVLVVSQPDRPAGRGGKPTPTPISSLALERGLRLLRVEDVNQSDSCQDIRSTTEGVDALVVIAFGQKLGEELLKDRFAINLHASLLPRWRGAAPIHAAILAGDAETGNSVITLAQRMDAGLVLGRQRTPILPTDTTGDLHDRLAVMGPELVQDVLSRHLAGTLVGEPQDQAHVTRARKLSKADGVPNFGREANVCVRQIHALNPWPTVTVSFRGEPLKLLRAAVEEDPAKTLEGGEPGTIVDAPRGLVTCANAIALRLIEVHPAGKRAMPWADFARGRTVRDGERLEVPGAP
ncbi:MAG: methionyl-tRNA formyltransferase [Phycisphaerales bacterium]|nr:MAG: methionyl-tRNA formyltransferase [Phycisphaerales bacterium]